MMAMRLGNAALATLFGALGIAAGYAVTTLGLPVREVLILGYLVVAPGAAIVWLARIKDPAMQLTLVVPLSLAVDALVATALLYAGIWSPTLALAVVAALTLAVVLMGAHEGSAQAALLSLTLLPPIVLLTGQL